MRAIIATIVITAGSWLISTSAVVVLALAYVWSQHDGRRRRAREMVRLLLRRDQPLPMARKQHAPRGAHRKSKRPDRGAGTRE